jgi:peptide/nickel transport system substrate-binding protein
VTELSFGLDLPAPTNWNVLARAGSSPATVAVADQLWPSVFDVGPSYQPVLNTSLVTSATLTSKAPETVVYRINPRATWSDGTPVTGADFVYNWQAQAGSPRFADAAGRPYTAATSYGYDRIGAVEASPASPDVVTVVFATPFPDWQELFSHLAPAHVARRVGFDSGFTDSAADLVSAGPYLVQSYSPGVGLRLVRNPSYDGPPAAALTLDIRFLPYQPQIEAALAGGQLSCATLNPSAAAVSYLRSAGLAVATGPGSAYLDLVFRDTGGPLRTAEARREVASSIDRGSIAAAVGLRTGGTAAVVGSRFFVPGEPGYKSGGPPPFAPTYRGPALQLVFGDDLASRVAGEILVSRLETEGIQVSARNVASVASVTAGRDWDLAIEIRTMSAFPASAILPYANDGATLSELVARASETFGSVRNAVIDQIDATAWSGVVDEPLVALPSLLACQPNVINAAPNPAPEGPAYNAGMWGIGGGP